MIMAPNLKNTIFLTHRIRSDSNKKVAPCPWASSPSLQQKSLVQTTISILFLCTSNPQLNFIILAFYLVQPFNKLYVPQTPSKSTSETSKIIRSTQSKFHKNICINKSKHKQQYSNHNNNKKTTPTSINNNQNHKIHHQILNIMI